MNSKSFSWDRIQALVGPATVPISIGSGIATGTITFGAGAYTDCTREILIGGTADGNIRVKFVGQTTTSVTIPVKAGWRYPWALTKIFATSTTVTNIWAFY